MDALSSILELVHARAQLDVRCLLGGYFDLPHTDLPAGEAAFHLVLSGECQLEITQGETYTMRRGHLALLPRGIAHSIRSLESSNITMNPLLERRPGALPIRYSQTAATLDMLCGRLLYDDEATALLFTQLPPVMVTSLELPMGNPTLATLAELLKSESLEERPGSKAILDALIRVLLGYGLREYTGQTPAHCSWLAVLSEPRLAKAVQAFLQNPGHSWTLDSLAKQAVMARATFARRFANCAGMAPGEFVTTVRMLIACKLLRESERTVADIALEVGYQSDAAFAKAFRLSVGVPPGHWRRRQEASQGE